MAWLMKLWQEITTVIRYQFCHVRTKKSVIEKIKNSKESPKDTMSTIFKGAGGFACVKGPNEIPRNRKQIYR